MATNATLDKLKVMFPDVTESEWQFILLGMQLEQTISAMREGGSSPNEIALALDLPLDIVFEVLKALYPGSDQTPIVPSWKTLSACTTRGRLFHGIPFPRRVPHGARPRPMGGDGHHGGAALGATAFGAGGFSKRRRAPPPAS